MKFSLLYFSFCLFQILLAATAFGQMNLTGNTLIFSTDATVAVADSNQLFTIRDIIISGNKKTRPAIILRELPFHTNEQYPFNVIAERFKQTKKQLMNTGLFSSVVVSLNSLQDHNVTINIQVEENWYLFPKPYIRTVDKNIHEWWTEKDKSMSRINYGINLTHKNFTGRNDKLKIDFAQGYTKQLSVQYYGLFLDRQLKWSASAGIAFGANKQVNYMTENNRQMPLTDNNQYLRSYFYTFLAVTYRPAIKTYHSFGISYNYENIADTIFKLNPYFSPSRNIVRYPEFLYRLSYFNVDFIPYPRKGYMAELTLKKKGLNDPVNLWQITAKSSITWPLKNKFFLNLRGVGMLRLPFRQPYITTQFLGYNDQYLQGYEYYIIDGVAGGYAKAMLGRPIFKTHLSIPSERIKKLNHIPLSFYAKAFLNAGYAYNLYPGQNNLTNKMLYSGGIGLDVVAFADFVIKIEWSFNWLGENGLYLHQRNYF